MGLQMETYETNNNEVRTTDCKADQPCPSSAADADDMSRGERVAYGVRFMETKENRVRLPRPRLPGRLARNKSLSDLDTGFRSAETNGASRTGSAAAGDDGDDDLDRELWIHYDYPFENLAMSGGGAKGYAYIGALKAFEDSGIFPKIKRVVGTSAGAVIAGMLVVNSTPQEIANFFKCDVKKLFQDKNAAMCLLIPRLLTKFGLNSGQRFYDMYGDFLKRKTGNADITFQQVVDTYDKEICVTVTNLSRMCSEYCHHTTTPDLPIRKAVRMSMAFPGIYESMKENLTGDGENIYVDGGTLENYPVQYYDDIDPNTEEPIFNQKTVGLYLISEDQFSHQIWSNIFERDIEQIPSYLPDTKLARERLKDEMKRRKKLDESFDSDKYIAELKKNPYYKDGKAYMRHYLTENKESIDIKGPKKYFRAMLSTLLLSQKHSLVKPADLERTIGINCGYIDTKDTGIEPGDREFMIRQGYEQTRDFLQAYVKRKVIESKSQHLKRPQSLPSALISYGSVLAKGRKRNSTVTSPNRNHVGSISESDATPTMDSDVTTTPNDDVMLTPDGANENQVVFSVSPTSPSGLVFPSADRSPSGELSPTDDSKSSSSRDLSPSRESPNSVSDLNMSTKL